MIDGTKLFFQLLRIALGFSLAIIAAGLFLSWGFFRTLSVHGGPEADIIQLIAITWSTIISASVIGALSLIPSGFAIGFAELMKWRGVIYHVSAGGLIALVLWGIGGVLPADLFYASNEAGSIIAYSAPGTPTPPTEGLRPGSSVAASAGFIAGFIYWLIAGRASGSWWMDKRPSNEDPR
ncbi:translation initiation factor 3 [Pseudovibrio brasiliensis]|uniref:Translation initiation factor 3 n=1 Tax=Pseudovibrio brasiliensis TaxID=1898042 RepID=A0ABX8AKR4_9HYPH|nr:translation initiation factor 3 [Pseudovibrio brasiliensis]QUS55685.1 translation initiation factor 3 [Pseudovibrio brasiliensis]